MLMAKTVHDTVMALLTVISLLSDLLLEPSDPLHVLLFLQEDSVPLKIRVLDALLAFLGHRVHLFLFLLVQLNFGLLIF